MQKEDITAIFDRQASSYDRQWTRLAPIYDALCFLTGTVLSELPPDANILCVGSGTGSEILYLAQRFPGWRFTAVEPSVPMLDVFRRKANEAGILSRCITHCGYLDSLPTREQFDAATAFLVSQFILDQNHRTAFFRGMTNRLRSHGILVSADLAGDMAGNGSQSLLEIWCRLMTGDAASTDRIGKMRQAYTTDVGVLPPADIKSIITHAGLGPPATFFQASLIHAWYAKKANAT